MKQTLSGDIIGNIYFLLPFVFVGTMDHLNFKDEVNMEEECLNLRISRAEWNEISSKHLITLYKENARYVGKNKTFATYNKLWEFISVQMKEKGYYFTAAQIKQKWDALVRSYKEFMNSKKSGQKRKICPYEADFDEIFQNKRNIIPEFMNVECPSDWNQNETSNPQPDPDPISSPPRTPIELILDETLESKKSKWSPMRKLRDMLNLHHREKMEATKRWRKEKLELKRTCEENRHKERMLLLEILKNNNS